jgi:hypothetical protein
MKLSHEGANLLGVMGDEFLIMAEGWKYFVDYAMLE